MRFEKERILEIHYYRTVIDDSSVSEIRSLCLRRVTTKYATITINVRWPSSTINIGRS